MNKTIASYLGATLVFGSLSLSAQDARPRLSTDATPTPTPTAVTSVPTPSPVPTPIPSPTPEVTPTPSPSPTPVTSSTTDESNMAGDTVKAADQILNTDPVLKGGAYSGQGSNAYDNLDIKRPFAAQPPSPANGVTLEQAVQTAIEHNADILKQIAEIKRTRGQVVQVRAQALPQLTASASYDQSRTSNGNSSSSSGTTSSSSSSSSSNSNSNVIGSVLINGVEVPVSSFGSSTSTSSQSSSTESKSWNVSFQVTQSLYSGGQVGAAIRAARIAEDSAFYQLRDTVDQTIASVRQQFYTVLLNRALIGVQEESVALLQSTLRDQQNRFEAGTVPRFNVLQAEVALANAQPNLIIAKNNYRVSQLTLAKLVGVSWPVTTDLTPYPIKGLLAYRPNNFTLNEAIELAKERRAFLKVQRQSILLQVENITIALAGYQPTLSGDLGYQIRNDSSSSSLSDTVEGWFFGFTGNWNIFDGFATKGKVDQARASLESARVTYEDSVRQVELEVQTAFLNLNQGRELIESQQKTVEQAQESLRLANERLSAGAGTQLDVLNAQVALTQAQTTALQAVATYNSNEADFDRVTGAITKYHDTFEDPLANKKARKIWLAKQKNRKTTLTDAEIRDNLNKRKAANQ